MRYDKKTRGFMLTDSLNEVCRRMDFRNQDTIWYEAGVIMLIALVGIAADLSSWTEISLFAKERIGTLRRYYPSLKKVPSDDTLRRFFSLVSPEALEECYRLWARAIMPKNPRAIEEDTRSAVEQRLDPTPVQGKHIAIDGKTIKGACSRKSGSLGKVKNAKLHIVSAFATEYGISLGQKAVDVKSNELSVIPELVELLDIFKGDVVTIDAMGTQTNIAEAITKKGADYVLVVKDNQKNLRKAIEEIGKEEEAVDRKRTKVAETTEVIKGVKVTRRCQQVAEPLLLGALGKRWSNLNSFGVITVTRTNLKTNEVTSDKHYFISSLGLNPEQIIHYRRAHWGIENDLHWRLDVQFGEDKDRKKDVAAQNFSLLNKLILALLKNDGDKKTAIKTKRKAISWSDQRLTSFIDTMLNFLA